MDFHTIWHRKEFKDYQKAIGTNGWHLLMLFYLIVMVVRTFSLKSLVSPNRSLYLHSVVAWGCPDSWCKRDGFFIKIS
jgi:hypothetical protein